MKKVRIYELSKNLGISNKELVEFLTDKLGLEVKSHSSSIDEEAAEKAIATFSKKPETPQTQVKAAPVPSPKAEPALQATAPPAPKIEQAEKEKAHFAPGGGPQTRHISQQPSRPHQDRRPEHGASRPAPAQGQAQGRPGQPYQARSQSQQARPEQPRKPFAPADGKSAPQKNFNAPVKKKDDKVDNKFTGKFTPPVEEEFDKIRAPRRRKRRGPKDAGPPGNQGHINTGTTATIREKLDPSFSAPAGATAASTPGAAPKPQLQTRTFPRAAERYRGRRDRSPMRAPEVTKKESVQKWMELPEVITIGELAQKLDMPANELIKSLMSQGIMAGINQNISFETAAQIVKKLGFKVEKEKKDEELDEMEELLDESKLEYRPPVVTVLGHVDHGKTSLLDAIRNTNVTAQESGGITQNIGASTVTVNDKPIIFVDTPGHEAFTAMRARGAKVTDIAILVVAAEDGVMPQTIEAINHAKAANVPIIVAINKIDKPDSNPDRVKQQLSDYGLIAEDWGGDTVMVPVSAKTKLHISDLLEMINLVAEMQELKANPNRPASGIIIESRLDKGLGPVATVIVQQGTLKIGDVIIAGNEWGRIRSMTDDRGNSIREAKPSFPASIVGLSGVPDAGDKLVVVQDEKLARDTSDNLKLQLRTDRMQSSSRTSLEDLFKQMSEGEAKDLNIIIKADVHGAIEPLKNSLMKLSNVSVRVNVIHNGIGAISESDVMLASASDAIIIGFNVRPDPSTKRLAEQEKVDVRLYRVIYDIVDDMKAAMTGMLEPEFEEVFQGRAEVRTIFKASKIGTIAGSYVQEGKITRNANIRVLRDNIVVYEGKLDSLRRFKDDAREVSAGFECGILIEKFPFIQQGDIVEAFTMKEIKRELPLPEPVEETAKK